MNAVGLIVLMVLWVLVVRQFGPATLGSLLVMLIWGFRILAHQGRDPRLPFDDFAEADYTQTVLITMGAGFVFLIAVVPLLSG